MNTITTPNFDRKITKIIEEVRARACIDEDAEIIKEILQDALTEECMMLNGYYEEEYYNALNTARNRAYDEGFNDGYDVGYDAGNYAV